MAKIRRGKGLLLLLRNEGNFWHEAPCYCFLVDVNGGFWMVVVISLWVLDDGCYFLIASGWLLLFPGGLWMVVVFPGGFWVILVISRWVLDGCRYFPMGPRWLLLFLDGFQMVAVISSWVLDGCYSFLMASGSFMLFPHGGGGGNPSVLDANDPPPTNCWPEAPWGWGWGWGLGGGGIGGGVKGGRGGGARRGWEGGPPGGLFGGGGGVQVGQFGVVVGKGSRKGDLGCWGGGGRGHRLPLPPLALSLTISRLNIGTELVGEGTSAMTGEGHQE